MYKIINTLVIIEIKLYMIITKTKIKNYETAGPLSIRFS